MQKAKVILSSLLVPLFLWASMGFSLNRHYCLGMLVDEAWYFVSNECNSHDTEKEQSCEETFSSSDSCCSEQWLSIAGVSVSSQAIEGSVNRTDQLSSNTAVLNKAFIFPASSYANIGKLNSPNGPPLLIKEIVIEYQRYLI